MRLADRLSAARHRRFVGRAAERAQFQATIAAAELPYQVLFVHGPGGVGKTSLLGEFAFQCSRAGVSAFSVDGRNVDPSPEAFLSALQASMGIDRAKAPLQALAEVPGRHAILVDTYETLLPLDSWLRDVFLPQAPDNVFVVLAGREPPSTAWRADPGWQVLLRAVSLRNLSPDEGRDYLAQRDVPAEQYRGLLEFTHGHPLALSLVADVFEQRGEVRFQPEAVPDVIKALLEQFVQKVPGPAHRTALEVCALLRQTTENLLAACLGVPDARELFDWLRDLSFVEAGPQGLFPHDLAREALLTDLRWRNPDWYGELHRRARAYYAARLPQLGAEEQQRLLVDYIFLHRDNPVVRPFFEALHAGAPSGAGASAVHVDEMRASDVPALEAAVRRHEGVESARLFAYWAALRPSEMLVLRDDQGSPQGLLAMLSLDQSAVDESDGDPAVAAASGYLAAHAPVRPSERATLFRFWMACETYQRVSPIQSLIFVNMVRHYLTTPGLAFTFAPCAEPDLWAAMFAYADLARIPEADFEVGGRHYGVYGHDWRAVPPTAWLDLLGEREIATAAPANQPATAPAEPLVVLSEPEFAVAVHDALRQFHRPDLVRANPLLRSHLVGAQAGPGAPQAERVAALLSLITEATQTLQHTPRDSRLFQAVDRTYLRPAATQEQAAELLDLPFSTYRRHLKAGVGRIAATLWQREIDCPSA